MGPLRTLPLLLLLRSLAALTASGRAAGERVEVTGGGIVRQGDNVTLSLVVGAEWDRCYWFRYGHLDNTKDFDYCIFDLDPATHATTLHKCSDSEMKAMLVPVSGDGLACTVLLAGMDATMEGKWAARLDTDLETKEVELAMQTPPSRVAVAVAGDEPVVGSPATATCRVTGGNPQPTVNFTLQSNTSKVREVKFSNQTVDLAEASNRTVTFSAIFIPLLEDLGASLACTTTQTDGTGLILAQGTALAPAPLQLRFPPQPAAPSTVLVVVGGGAELEAAVECRPEPSSAVWTVDCGSQANNDTGCGLSLAAGQAVGRLNSSKVEGQVGEGALVTDQAGADSYMARLAVAAVQEVDLAATYSLTVTNAVGTQVLAHRGETLLTCTAVGL
jgi:hypothetical protein